MRDPRMEKVAQNLVNYSIDVQEKDHVMIMVYGKGEPLAKELIRQIYAKGAYPHVRSYSPSMERELFMGFTEEQVTSLAGWEEPMWRGMQGFINIQGIDNDSEFADVRKEKRQLYGKAFQEIFHYVDNQLKGIRINYPTMSLAQKANMSTEAFENFYFDVCSLDYRKLYEASLPLKQWMERTDRVRITGPGTEVTFSIRGIPALIAAGKRNMPDGEVYTSPVRDSVNGVITYNTPSQYMGTNFDQIRFVFENGKIIEATSNDTKRLNEILDTDEGARYLGEFAIGTNPYILHPMNDILFDEKIFGSFHLTPGRAYEAADNGNRSIIHWDLINIQRPEYGGGEIWFDDVLMRKDGLFVPQELQLLNPDQLKR